MRDFGNCKMIEIVPQIKNGNQEQLFNKEVNLVGKLPKLLFILRSWLKNENSPLFQVIKKTFLNDNI